jgi:hypothetical protein
MQATFRIKVKLFWNKSSGEFEVLDTSVDDQDDEDDNESQENDENNNHVEGVFFFIFKMRKIEYSISISMLKCSNIRNFIVLKTYEYFIK